MNLRVLLAVSIDVGAEKGAVDIDDVRERVDATLHAARQRGDFLGCMTGSHVTLLGRGMSFTAGSWRRLVEEHGWSSLTQRELLERFIFEHSELSAAFGVFVETTVAMVREAATK